MMIRFWQLREVGKDLPMVRFHFGRLWAPKRFTGLTIPPFGVFIRKRRYLRMTDESKLRLLRHEAVHWEQYERYGLFGVYWRYAWGRLRHGYRENPAEVEARERAGSPEEETQ